MLIRIDFEWFIMCTCVYNPLICYKWVVFLIETIYLPRSDYNIIVYCI